MRLFRRRTASQARAVDSLFDESGHVRLQCWYCEEPIAHRGFDPCAVILVTNWPDEQKQREQQFFAHAECFRKSGSGTDLYVFEPDFEQG